MIYVLLPYMVKKNRIPFRYTIYLQIMLISRDRSDEILLTDAEVLEDVAEDFVG